jgi:hypothetical protein
MPGKHVDEVYEKASQLIQFQKFLATEEQGELAKMTTEEKVAYQENKEDSEGKKMGRRVFNGIESSPLTPAEKQEVYLRLAQEGVKREIAETEHIGTLMRGDTALTQFMSTYMGTYAKGYIEAMTETAVKEVGKVELPKWTEGKVLGMIGAPIQGVTEKQLKEMDQVALNLSRRLAHASVEHVSKLSPEARGFLASTLAPLRETDTATLNFVATNTLVLRTVCPQVQIAASKMEDRNLGRIVQNANIVFQTYSNRLTSDKKGTKPQDILAEDLIRDEKMKVNTFRMYSALTSPESIDDLMSLNAKTDEFMRRIPEGKQLTDLESKLEKLSKRGPNLEKLKAKASSDGIEGTKRKLEVEVRELKKLEQEIDTLDKKIALGGGKTGVEVGEGLEVQTPSQTTVIQPEKETLKVDVEETPTVTSEKVGEELDDLDLLIQEVTEEVRAEQLGVDQMGIKPEDLLEKIQENPNVAQEELSKGLDDLDRLIQELAEEVDTEQLEIDQMGITPKDLLEEIELTVEDMKEIEDRLKDLEEGIDQDSVDVEELESLIRDLEAPTLKPQVQIANTPKPDVSAYEARIQNLQKERQRLEKSTAGDRFKAFFKHGFKGVKGERDQLETKIEATTAAKDMVLSGVSTETQRQKIEQLKQGIAETKHTLREHRGILAVEGLARGMNTKTGFTQEQLETAQTEGLKAEEKLDVLKAELKMEKKVLSVREKLGMKDFHPGEGVKAPTHGHGV